MMQRKAQKDLISNVETGRGVEPSVNLPMEKSRGEKVRTKRCGRTRIQKKRRKGCTGKKSGLVGGSTSSKQYIHGAKSQYIGGGAEERRAHCKGPQEGTNKG